MIVGVQPGSFQLFTFLALLTTESLRLPSETDSESDKIQALYKALFQAQDSAQFENAGRDLLTHFQFSPNFADRIDWKQFSAEEFKAIRLLTSKSFTLDAYDGGACRKNFGAFVNAAKALES